MIRKSISSDPGPYRDSAMELEVFLMLKRGAYSVIESAARTDEKACSNGSS